MQPKKGECEVKDVDLTKVKKDRANLENLLMRQQQQDMDVINELNEEIEILRRECISLQKLLDDVRAGKRNAAGGMFCVFLFS